MMVPDWTGLDWTGAHGTRTGPQARFVFFLSFFLGDMDCIKAAGPESCAKKVFFFPHLRYEPLFKTAKTVCVRAPCYHETQPAARAFPNLLSLMLM